MDIFLPTPDYKPKIRRGETIVRYWRNNESGLTIEVASYQITVPDQQRRVIYYDPEVVYTDVESGEVLRQTFAMTLEEFKAKHTPIGNFSVRPAGH